MTTGSTHKQTKLARVPLMLLDYAERQGLDRAVLMKRSSLTPQALADPDSRVQVRSVLELWRAIIEGVDEPTPGLDLGRTVSAKDLGLVGYVMYYSADLFEAILCLERFYRILSEAVRFDVTRDDKSTTLRYSAHPTLVALRHPIEAPIAAVVQLARELSGEAIVPESVQLPFPKHASQRAFRGAFGTQPQFNSIAPVIVFSNQHMELPVKATDPALSGYLTELAETTLQGLRMPDHDFEQQVRETLWSMLPHGKPDLWRTAEKMGISARTLQRRLQEDGSSFSAVLEGLRRSLSVELLADRRLAVADVAFLLGYSEPSAFQRAFRRWHDTSPGSYKTG